MNKKWAVKAIALVLIVSGVQIPKGYFAFGEENDFYGEVQGSIKIQKSSDVYGVNPYNPQKITPVGESGALLAVISNKTVSIPLKAPLYRISGGYYDSIIKKDGVWGIERNIVKKVFDGTEDWEMVLSKKYQNNNTTIFSCPLGEKTPIKEGVSTHFALFTEETQRNNLYDGISINSDGTKCYVRIMNVRNVKTVEALKQYLAAQNANGAPVTFYFAAQNKTFEPLEKQIQTILNEADFSKMGFVDTVPPVCVTGEEKIEIQTVFENKDTYRKKELLEFMESVKDIRIYNGAEDKKYWIQDIIINKNINECVIKIASSHLDGSSVKTAATASFSFFDCDFISGKPTEILFDAELTEGVTGIMQIDFSNYTIPEKSIENITFEQTGFSKISLAKKELVLPEKIMALEGEEYSIYYNNALLNGDIDKKDTVKAIDERYGENEDNRFSFEIKKGAKGFIQEFGIYDNGLVQKSSVAFVPVSKEAGAGVEANIMFLGDSLIDQNHFTQQLQKKFESDAMNINLIGTRGSEGNLHEGRGGWSAYDYLYEKVRYGVNNPFLNHSKFDFSYFMESNQLEDLDAVFISLGINDLNQQGHNTHDEILKNYTQLLQSIKRYRPDIKLFLGMPTMLYSKDATLMAKNTRLSFIQDMMKEFGQREGENIYLVPLYMNIDPFMSYKFEQQSVTDDNPTGAMAVKDTTHPRIKGYEQMADVAFAYLKYAWME